MRHPSRTVSIYLLATFLLCGLSPVTARAAAITVTTTADESGTGEACSLREAIESANGNDAVGGCATGDTEQDVITVPAGDYTLGATQLLIFQGSTKLVGAGAAETVVAQTGPSRVLLVQGATAEIEGMTFTGGNAGSDGGAILATSSNVTIRDSTIVGNTGTFGGGYCQFNSTATLVDVLIQDNVATNNGGGVFNNTSTLTITGGEIRSNQAQSGGGLYNSGGSTLTVAGTWFEGNDADSSGGGLYNAGRLDMTQALVEQNLAQHGGGMRNDGLGIATITQSAFVDNEASTGGGGILNAATMTLDSSTIELNTASSLGGGMYSSGRLDVVNGTIVEANQGNVGGGIYCNDCPLDVADSSIDGNIANADGGGLYATGPVALARVTINGNRAARGGGLRLAGTDAPSVLANVTVSGNFASGDGGGIYNLGSVQISNATVFENTADFDTAGGGDGGGIYANAGSRVEIRNSIVSANTAVAGPDCAGEVESLGHNLITTADGCVLPELASDVTGVEAELAPLAFAGGLTLVHALLPGSPAIDAASPSDPGSSADACEELDARAVERPQNADDVPEARCDMGAFEGRAQLNGDTTCDGEITTSDALSVLRDAVGLGGGECLDYGDANCDEARTASDALAILQYAVGNEPAAPPTCLPIGALT